MVFLLRHFAIACLTSFMFVVCSLFATIQGYAFTEQIPFKDIKVTGKNGQYEVVGQIQTSIEELFYIVEDGHNEMIPETKIKVEKEKDWSQFKLTISIPTHKLPKQGSVILYLYKHGHKGYPVLLDRFE